MADPFSPAGQFEQRLLDAEQERAQERARARAKAEGRDPPAWAEKHVTSPGVARGFSGSGRVATAYPGAPDNASFVSFDKAGRMNIDPLVEQGSPLNRADLVPIPNGRAIGSALGVALAAGLAVLTMKRR